MTDIELAKLVEEAYDRYFLAKAKSSDGGYAYRTDVFKFLHWLKHGKMPNEEGNDLVNKDRKLTRKPSDGGLEKPK